jgi:chromosome segregation protein
LNDPGLRALMNDWLNHIYIADDTATAFAERSKLPLGGLFVTRQGHVVSNASVRFYASDSEQDGMLARQQEIENITKQQRAQSMLAEEARAAPCAPRRPCRASQRLQELRQRVNSLTQSAHSLQIEVMKLAEVQERFNQRSTQIATDLEEIGMQEAEQQQVRPNRGALRSSISNWPSCRSSTKTARPIT